MQLKERFDVLDIPSKKGLLLARYLVEPQDVAEVIYNENAKSQQEEVLQVLRDTLGEYKLFSSDPEEDDNYIIEKDLQDQLAEKFGKCRNTLVEALQCEDFEEKGVIDLTQFREAIHSVDDELNTDLMDYLLHYVYVRSSGSD